MKNKYLLVIVVILGIGAIISSLYKKKTTFLKPTETVPKVTIKDSKTSDEHIINLEDYVVGVVAGEMPASFKNEALKAQAIAARTYAAYKMATAKTTYDLTTDVSNQVYITKEQMQEKWQQDYEKYYEKIKQAVEATKDLVMKYNGEVISSYYFAMSNGSTEDVALVFGENKDYLKSVDSKWDEKVKNFESTKTFDKESFCTALKIDCLKIEIKDIQRSSSGRVNSITINNQTFKGTEVRTLLNLRSTDFDISIDDLVTLTTKGYGHGVGMSQYGANEMAKEGFTYEQILKHYYQDVDITKLNV